MSDFAIEFADAERFAAALQRAPQVMRDELLRSTDRITLQGEAWAKAEAPVKTGQLRRSIAHKPATSAGGSVTGSFGTATPYARPVEFGRRGFSARPGGVLAFTVGGKKVFTKRVGPARARPFMRPAVAKLRPLVPREYGAALQRVLNQLGGAL